MPLLKTVDADDKPAVGKRLNEVKKALESAFEQAKARAGDGGSNGQPSVDLTEPGLAMGIGRRHVLSRTIDEVTEVFARMGFTAVTGPEVEDDWHEIDQR